jgi:hypothetical protein
MASSAPTVRPRHWADGGQGEGPVPLHPRGQQQSEPGPGPGVALCLGSTRQLEDHQQSGGALNQGNGVGAGGPA